ncbi:U-box domain-containing protein 33 isoform X2 [Eucalyptus grandis]|uniref:U-box domain-containing protein 33 isoform X2 n=1 Tax=Eucalyptus grandis TaxID=71139 RepID=UPI00192E88EA|nr:U-box domain-containing protein 33 isoform X2 [Eucalyptus grandis]
MTRGDEGSSSGAAPGNVYVAVGSDGAEGETMLLWALQNFGGDFKYCILHVGQPGEFARENTNKILDAYIQMCNHEKDVRQGIVELVEQHCIRKLVMGAAADRHYIEGMAQLKSTKAMFVNEHAHPSCEIWFICRGNPVYLRESRSSTSYPVRSHVQSGQSTPGSDNSGSDSSIAADDQALVQFESPERSKESLETDPLPAVHQPPFRAAEGVNSEELCEHLHKVISDVTKAKREACDESICRYEAEKAAIKAKCKANALENSYAEELSRRIDLEKMLKNERERCKMIENERNGLQTQLEIALANRQDQEVIAKFSLSEIQEAIGSFHPHSKIEEGDYGSTYKGFLRHTQVIIKMMYSDSPEDKSQYHQEVRIASVLRHPNLVTLIGVCPEAWAIIYEYLPNGNLEDWLSGDNAAPLSWQTRIQICRDTCAALIFLHSFEPHGIAHGDLTPKNFLLDANFVAKLSNFRSHDAPFSSHATGDFSAESDIYSFGVVLLRLLVGQAALDLDDIVQNALNNNELDAVLDQTAGQWPLEQVTELARLALSCCGIDNSNRPDLRLEVWPLLEQIQTLCEQASSSDRSSGGTQQSSSSHHSPGEEHTQPPSYFLCPITQELMEDPVMAADGHTYEAEAIREWLNRHDTSPMTNLQLQNLDLIPNRIVRLAIQEWRRINGSLVWSVKQKNLCTFQEESDIRKNIRPRVKHEVMTYDGNFVGAGLFLFML